LTKFVTNQKSHCLPTVLTICGRIAS